MNAQITQLLVHCDASARMVQRLEIACRLAQRHGSALMALYAATPRFVELPFAPEIGSSMVTDLRQIDQQFLTQARAAFDRSQLATQASTGIRASWGVVHDDPMMAAFAQQALFADLLVLGQHDPSDAQAPQVPSDFVQSITIMSGKPALVVPYINVPRNVGETVLIAWKPTREAARAVSAAVPLLQSAKSVHVVTWGSEEIATGGEHLDLAAYLRLRGIEANWHVRSGEPKDLGDLLLSEAFDCQADLLVMGCYGHSRAREWVLGGVSRTILQSMTLPVLMAH
jgi:nucleotide-binding universal stress UspA family protein